MTKSNPFKWRHYEAEIILLCVRWYLNYLLSYRQVAEMVNERGWAIHHTTIYCWIQEYDTELDKRCRSRAKRSGGATLLERGLRHSIQFLNTNFRIVT